MQSKLVDAIEHVPAVVLIGPRQVGKTTLAKTIQKEWKKKPVEYLDLESPDDLAKLRYPESYLKERANVLVIIDEIQIRSELFILFRSLIDRRIEAGEKSAHFLLLGSASPEIIQSSFESLAGRIRYLELAPVSAQEICRETMTSQKIRELWVRGGFPKSVLAPSESESWKWRSDFIRSYVERDIPLLIAKIEPTRMRQFWHMLAHYHGQQINYTSLSKSLSVSHMTVRSYLDIMNNLFFVRYLPPWASSTKKRMVKSPKIYVRDTGLLHYLLKITNYDDLLIHPVLGHSWEGFVIENIVGLLSDQWNFSYYRTASQSEIDLILEGPRSEVWAIEIKLSSSPEIRKGFHTACRDVKATRKIIVYSGKEEFPIGSNTTVMSLMRVLKLVRQQSNLLKSDYI